MPVYVGKMGSGTLVSDDDGATWQRSNIVDDYEPTVVLLKDGRLLMYLRTDKGEIYQSYSEDNGLTWSKSQPSGIPSPSSMSTLKRLQNGDLMLIFNKVRDRGEINGPWPRIRLCTMISQDEGQSWGKLRYLDGGDQFVDILKIMMRRLIPTPISKHRLTLSRTRTIASFASRIVGGLVGHVAYLNRGFPAS